MIREIILDTETTGLDPSGGHRIIEVGALEMVNKVLTGNKFHYYINPQRDVPNEAYKVHGIASEFLKDKPLFSEIVQKFISFISNSKMVIHNAPFDIKFINHELKLCNLPLLDINNTIDTLILAKKKFPGSRVNLDALCKRYKIDNSSRVHHGALKDAALLAEVYVELIGGRQSSFEMVQAESVMSSSSKLVSVRHAQEGNKLVIFPKKDEISKHKEFLKKILS